MRTAEFEQDIRAALAQRADSVPSGLVDNVRTAHYRVRTVGLSRAVPTAAVVATIAAGGALVATHRQGPASRRQVSPSTTQVHALPVAYVGHAPRLAVTRLPRGFRPGPDIPVPTLFGRPPAKGELPQRTFVAGTGADESYIVVAEGTNGEGPVPKLLSFAADNPAATTEQAIDGDTLTIVDLGSVSAGAGYVVYFPVSSSTWALIGGGVGVTVGQLVTVAEGVINAGS